MSTVRERSDKKQPKSTNNETSSQEDNKKLDVKNDGCLATLLRLDEDYTCRCAVFADKTSSLRPLMKLIEISCHGIPWIFGTVVFILSVHQAHHIELLVNLFYGLVIDLIIIAALKVAFRRSRPAHNEMDMFVTLSIDNYSFPSGHASRAGLLACFFILHVAEAPMWVLLMLLWSCIVTLSRVMLGRHHVIDVICGYIVGIGEYLLLVCLWVPRVTCLSWLELYFSHFHL